MDLPTKKAPFLLLLNGTLVCLLIYSCTTTSFNGKNFQHPVALALIIFLGEALNLVPYILIKKKREREREGTGNTHSLTNGDVQYKQRTLFIVGTLDAISSIILIAGMGITYPTIFIFCSLSSLYFVHLLAHLYRENHGKTHQWIGFHLVTIGIFLICIFRVFTYEDDDKNKVITGIYLVLLGSCIKSFSLSILDHYFKSLNNPALSVTGIKALYGLLVTALFYIFFSFVKVFPPFYPILDDVKGLLFEIKNTPMIIFYLIMLCLFSFVYEGSAMFLIKNRTPEQKIAVDVVRVFAVAPMSLLAEWEPQSILLLVSAILTLFGLFVYFDSTFLIKAYKAVFVRPRRGDSSTDDTSNITQSSPAETA